MAHYPRRFHIGDSVQIGGITGPHKDLNACEGFIQSDAYMHPNDEIVFDVAIPTKGLLIAVSPWFLKKTYVDPYDGNELREWKDCVWQPPKDTV